MTEPAEPFAIHPQLARDSVVVGDLQLSRVLLMNNSRFPWLLLVPRRPVSASSSTCRIASSR